jgi:hypothetical protein
VYKSAFNRVGKERLDHMIHHMRYLSRCLALSSPCTVLVVSLAMVHVVKHPPLTWKNCHRTHCSSVGQAETCWNQVSS